MAGKNRRTGSDRLRDKARALIDRGLSRYSRGELDAAIVDWRHALALDPRADDARQYIERVQANQDILTVPRAPEPGETGEPFPIEAIDDFAGETSGDIDLALDDIADMDETNPGLPLPETREDEDWPLSDRPPVLPAPAPPAAASPAPPAAAPGARRPKPSRQTIMGPPMPLEQPGARDAEPEDGSIPEDTEARGNGETDADTTQPIAAGPEGGEVPDAQAVVTPVDGPDTEPTERPPAEAHMSLAPTVEIPRTEAERISHELASAAEAPGRAPGRDIDLAQTLEMSRVQGEDGPLPPVIIEDIEDEDEGGEDRASAADPAESAPSQPRTRTAQLFGAVPQLPFRPPQGVASTLSKISAAPGDSAGSAPARGAAPSPSETHPDDPVAQKLLESLYEELPAGDREPRERLLWLIERAQFEYVGGDYEAAVAAAELAFETAANLDDGQELIQHHAENLIEIYESFEGDLYAVPSLAMSPGEYGKRGLDSRAAFLLSRVDGMLTIDDLLAVAGMPPLETHRHLSHLLRQGILTLR